MVDVSLVTNQTKISLADTIVNVEIVPTEIKVDLGTLPSSGSGGGSGAVDSVNGQTGVVVLTTSHISEGSNFYFTNARAVTALTGQNISLFVNNAGYITGISGFDTDDLAEGATNLYYTEARVSANTDVAANTAARHAAVTVTDSAEIDFTLTGQNITASLIAGSIDETKLDASTNASLDLADSSVQPGDNISVLVNDAGYLTGIGSFDTDDLAEGATNLYFTDERAQDAVGGIFVDSADIDFTYSDATPSITGVLTASGVTASTYGAAGSVPQLAIDSKGRVTSASNVAIAITKSQVTDFVESAYVHTTGTETIGGDKTFSGNVIVGGNLTVQGTVTAINSNTVNIGDNIIVLNSDETGTPTQDGGIEIERGTSSNAFMIWQESTDQWGAKLGAGAFDAFLLASNIGSTVQAFDATLASLAAVAGVQGDILYASGTDTWTRLAKDTNATRYLSNTGTSNNPAWAQVSLANGVTGTLQATNFPALTGDVTTTAGSLTTAIATGVIVNADINNSAAIALTKLATQAANSLVANDTTGVAVPKDIAISASRLVGRDATGNITGQTVGGGVEFITGGIQRSALTGAITASAGSNTTALGSFTSANLAAALTDETGSGAAVFATSPTLVTPALGTPSSATLTNATGLPISTGVSGLGTGVATFLGTPSSANLAAALTDETGSGSAVFATSPTLSGLTSNSTGNIVFANGGALRTGTTAGDGFTLQAYDVDAATYLTGFRLTANNNPSFVATLGSAASNATFDSSGNLTFSGGKYLAGFDTMVFGVNGLSTTGMFFRAFTGTPGIVAQDLAGAETGSFDINGGDSVINAIYGFSDGEVTHSAVSASQNNVSLANGGTHYFSATTPVNFTGFVAPTASRSQKKQIYNTGTNAITVTNNDAASSAANRTRNTTGAPIVLNQYEGAQLSYNNPGTYWSVSKL